MWNNCWNIDDALQRACLRFRPNCTKGLILVGTSYHPPLIRILDYIATVPFQTIRNHSQATTINETSMIKKKTCLSSVREITYRECQIYDIFVSTSFFFLSGLLNVCSLEETPRRNIPLFFHYL